MAKQSTSPATGAPDAAHWTKKRSFEEVDDARPGGAEIRRRESL